MIEFTGFPKMARLSRECVITEKVDGCFHYNSKVLTEKGYRTIGSIVNQKKVDKVLSYNFTKKQFEMVKIINWFKQPSSYKEFLHIKLKGFKQGAAYCSFRCTPNHLILTQRGYIRADQLEITDKLYSPNNPLTFIQQQMILGSLLGDANIQKYQNNTSFGYSHSQSVKHKNYSNTIKKLLGRFFISERIIKGGYANTDITRVNSNFDINLQKYIKNFIKNNKKYFSYESLKDMSAIALAFWYMDDGSTFFSDDQKARISLHTQGFSEEQIDILIQTIKNKFNLFPNKFNYGKGFQLSFTSPDSIKFFDFVAPYICPDLQYKLPLEYRTGTCYWDNYKENNSIFYEQEILEIKPNITAGRIYNYKYDLETENHNYIVSGIVVHNSNACIRITEGGEFLVGSRTRWITPENDNFGFAKWAHEHKGELIQLGPGQHFGEWYGEGIQRRYGLTEKRFVLFNTLRWCLYGSEPQRIETADPRIEKYQEVLPACCGLVPILYRGIFDTREVDKAIEFLKINGSQAVPGFMKPEGIVVFHIAAGIGFKKTIEKDDQPKGKA